MDKEIFVQNIKIFCARKGTRATAACQEAGVGASFVSDLNRGRVPSVAKVQQLAAYLGVTTSELLGEPLGEAGALDPEDRDLLDKYHRADQRARAMVDLALEPYAKKEAQRLG